MTQLVDIEEIHFRPRDGVVDLEAAAAAIAPIGFSYRDPHVPEMFLVFDDDESRESCRAVRAEDPYAQLPYVLMIRVEPDDVYVNQFAGPRFGPYACAFVTWLLATYPCRVFTESGREIEDLVVEVPEA